MQERQITIKATGCHDCKLMYEDWEDNLYFDYRCTMIDSDIERNVEKRTFHPDCPMQPVNEENNA